MLLAFFVAGLLDWGGEDAVSEANPYCEALQEDSMILQPVNTWSNLAPILVGLAILLHLARVPPAGGPNPMAERGFFPLLYGLLVIWLGPGSMFYHASMKQWGGWLDNLSMNLFVLFPIAYDLCRLRRWGRQGFLAVYLPAASVLAVLGWLVQWEHFGKLVFGLLIAAAICVEVAVAASDRLERRWRWLLIGLGIFGAAFVIWILSGTGAPLCAPRSAFQGHALWHVLAAVATLCFYVYFRSERRTTA